MNQQYECFSELSALIDFGKCVKILYFSSNNDPTSVKLGCPLSINKTPGARLINVS